MIAPPALYTSAWITSGPDALPHQGFLWLSYFFLCGQLIKVLFDLHLWPLYRSEQGGWGPDQCTAISPRSASSQSAVDSHLHWGGGRGRGLWSILKRLSRYRRSAWCHNCLRSSGFHRPSRHTMRPASSLCRWQSSRVLLAEADDNLRVLHSSIYHTQAETNRPCHGFRRHLDE